MATNTNQQKAGVLPGAVVQRLLGISRKLRPQEDAIRSKAPQVRTTVMVGNTPQERETRSLAEAWASVNPRAKRDGIEDADLRALMDATDAAVLAENARGDKVVADMGLTVQDADGKPISILTREALKEAAAEGRKAVRLLGGGKSTKKTERVSVPEDQAVLVKRGLIDAGFNCTRDGAVWPKAYLEASAEVQAILAEDAEAQFALELLTQHLGEPELVAQ